LLKDGLLVAMSECHMQLGDTSLPEEEPESTPEMETDGDEELLKKLHHVLLEVCR
jgi:hypothetical protein